MVMCTCTYKRNAMVEGTLCCFVELEPGDRVEALQILTTEAVEQTSNPWYIPAPVFGS